MRHPEWTYIMKSHSVSELWQQQNQSTIDPRNFSKETTVSPLSFLHPATPNNGLLQKVHFQVGQLIAQDVDLVEISSLLLRANLSDVPKIHSQIFINPMTTNVVAIHKKLWISTKTKTISLYYLIQRHRECIFDS